MPSDSLSGFEKASYFPFLDLISTLMMIMILTVSEFTFPWSALNVGGVRGPIQMSYVGRGYLKNEALMKAIPSIFQKGQKGHAIQ